MSVRDRWDIVVPVKGLAAAKSRLVGVDPVLRGRLALAFATDAVTAALAVPAVRRVLVVTKDPVAAAHLSRLGAHIVPESRGPGLNAAIEAGLDAVVGTVDGVDLSVGSRADLVVQSDAARVAVMTGDLPAVQPAEIAAALAAATGHLRAIVADAEGTGTVLLTADGTAEHSVDESATAERPAAADGTGTSARAGTAAGAGSADGAGTSAGVRIRPQFGPGSCARHRADGHVLLSGAFPGLRRDVDTWAGLEEARRLGLGAATSAVAASLQAAG